ncbi:MAG: hypothetical protein II921_08545 [Treponema sp.]|nr:hypothetical protein [Treponema sp.]
MFFLLFSLCAQKKQSEPADSYFDALFFEITRFSLSGFSPLKKARDFAPVSRQGALILGRNYFDPRTNTCLLFAELSDSPYMRERIGMIESTKTADDFVSFDFSSYLNGKRLSDGSYFFSWIDRILSVTVPPEPEPEFPTGDEILSMIDDIKENRPSEQAEEMSWFDRDGNIRKYTNSGEQFFVNHRMYVNTFENKIARYTYDDSYRLLQSEKLEMGSSAKDLKKVLVKTFTYNSDSIFPSKGVEEDFSNSTKTNSLYNDKGLCYLREKFSVGTDEKKKLTLEKKTRWTYDDKDRMTSEENIDYNYVVDKKGKKKTERFRTKHELVYTDFPTPDKKYYEDGVLRVARIFTAEKDYDEIVYFDEGFKIVIHYEDGMRKTEIVYFGDKEVRRRNLEK